MALAGVAALCLVVLALGWWIKARCLPGGWQGGEEYLAWCYTDVYALFFDASLDEGAVPYRDHPLEYPVLTGAQLWGGAAIVDAAVPAEAPPEQRAAAFMHVTALGLGLAGLGALAALAATRVRPARLLWFAGAPTLAVSAFTNWDLVPVALLAVALAAHLADRDGIAGAAAGLGAAAKLFPAVLVPLVVAARLAQGRRRAAGVHLAAAAASWVAVNAPVALAWPESWWWFFEFSRSRETNFDSLWYVGEQVAGARLPVEVLNPLATGVLLAGWAAIAVVGTRRRDPAVWWQLALPLLCWFLLTNKVYSPQYTLWLLPLVVLAAPRAPPVVLLLAADLLVFLVEFPFLGGVLGYEPAPGYAPLAAALLLRAVALAWLLVEATARRRETECGHREAMISGS